MIKYALLAIGLLIGALVLSRRTPADTPHLLSAKAVWGKELTKVGVLGLVIVGACALPVLLLILAIANVGKR